MATATAQRPQQQDVNLDLRFKLLSWQRYRVVDGDGQGFVTCGMRPWEDNLHLLAHGGVGSGKTRGGAMRHFMHIIDHPGSQGAIVTPDYSVMLSSTLPAWRKFLADVGLPLWAYDYRVNDHQIIYWNGCIDFLKSADDPAKLVGFETARQWWDEGALFTEEAVNNLEDRNRQPGFAHQIYCTTTPTIKRHWLYKKFYPKEAYEAGYLSDDEYEAILHSPGRTVAYRASTKENFFNPPWYYESRLARYGGPQSLLARRQLEGEFLNMEGMVYPMWDTEKYALPRDKWPAYARTPNWKPDNVAMGSDFGSNHPSGLVVPGVDHFGRAWLLDEWRKPSSPPELASEAVRLARKWGVTVNFSEHDPAWFRPLKEALGGIGVACWRADKHYHINDPSGGGIGLVMELLNKTMPDGYPALIVDRDTCPKFCSEMENYQRAKETPGKPYSEMPVKVDDDLEDPFRYALVGMTNRLRWFESSRPRIMQATASFGRG